MGSYLSAPVDDEPSSLSYYPRSQDDVFVVRLLLIDFVPLEIADIIIEMAQYWPKMSSRIDRTLSVTASRSERNNASCCCLVTQRIPKRKLHPGEDPEISMKVRPRIVRFLMKSHDQGWSDNRQDHGTYSGSWTWMEAAILRSSPDTPDPWWWDVHSSTGPISEPTTHGEAVNPNTGKTRWLVQRNVCASGESKYHEVIWTDSDDDDDESALEDSRQTGRGSGQAFVQSLLPGDRVAVFARALFPGWVNYAEEVEVDIFYSV